MQVNDETTKNEFISLKGSYVKFVKISIISAITEEGESLKIAYNENYYSDEYIDLFLSSCNEIISQLINCDLDITQIKDLTLSTHNSPIKDIDGNSLPSGVIGEIFEDNGKTGYYGLEKNNEVIRLTKIKDELNGFRYYPEEIISTIKECDSNIVQVKIKVVKINDLNKLCAYFTANDKVNINNLKIKLSKKLVEYKRPEIFIEVENINELPEPRINIQNTKPTNEKEEKVYRLCCDVLGFNDFGITDDLTKLGLSYYKKLKLNEMIYDVFKINLDSKIIFNSNTIKSIADSISNEEFNQLLDGFK